METSSPREGSITLVGNEFSYCLVREVALFLGKDPNSVTVPWGRRQRPIPTASHSVTSARDHLKDSCTLV